MCTAHECVAPSTLKGNTNHDVLGVFVVVPRHVALALPVRASHALPATVARRRAHQQLPVRGAAPHHSDTIRWHGGGRYRQAGKASTRPGMRDVGSAHMQACCGPHAGMLWSVQRQHATQHPSCTRNDLARKTMMRDPARQQAKRCSLGRRQAPRHRPVAGDDAAARPLEVVVEADLHLGQRHDVRVLEQHKVLRPVPVAPIPVYSGGVPKRKAELSYFPAKPQELPHRIQKFEAFAKDRT